MPKLFQENLDLRPEDLVAGLLGACDIKEPPTNEQLVFDFLKLTRETLPTGVVSKLSPALGIEPRIRAMLHLREQLVLVHPTLETHPERYAWASLHEVGHYVLPEHREILFRCSWQDLSPLAQKWMETEANRFAANLVFQNDRFTKEAADKPLTMKAPLGLRDRYRVSFEAAIRQYVEKNPRPCALVVYRPTRSGDVEPPLEVQYTVRSPSWRYFGYVIPHQLSSADSAEHQIFYRKSRAREIVDAEFVAGSTAQSAQVFPSELFSNTYRVFQLIHPPK